MHDTEERELTEVESAVYLLYLELAEEPQDWVRIARFHEHLPYHPADINAAIVDLVYAGEAHIAPESATRVLTREDKAAAVRDGSEDCHLIAFGED